MKHELEECIGSRLRGLSRKVDNIYRQHLEGTGITENQLTIMMALYTTGVIEQIEIGKLISLERSSLSRNLIRIVDQGYILKEGPVNRPLISLTKKGVLKVDSVIPAWEGAMDEVLSLLDKKALAGFNHFENRLRQS